MSTPVSLSPRTARQPGQEYKPLSMLPESESLNLIRLAVPHVTHDPTTYADSPEHLRDLAAQAGDTGRGRLSVYAPGFTRPWTDPLRPQTEINISNFYVASTLPATCQSIPLEELARGWSVGLGRSSESVVPGILTLSPLIIRDTQEDARRYNVAAPELEKAWGAFVTHAVRNVLPISPGQRGVTTLFVGAAAIKTTVNFFTPDPHKIVGINLYARSDAEGSMSFFGKAFSFDRDGLYRLAAPVNNESVRGALDATLGQVGFKRPGTSGALLW